MKNFLIVIFGMLINALYLYVIGPIFITGIMAWLWVPLFFESSFASIIGIVITILTLVVTSIIEYKLESF